MDTEHMQENEQVVVAVEQPVEVVVQPVEEAVAALPEFVQEAPVEEQGAPLEETVLDSDQTVGQCDSCGSKTALFDVEHHQSGNNHVWHYCERCKAAHDREQAVVAGLKELMHTHPAQTNDPKTVGMLRDGKSVEDVKAELDKTIQPELEAEIVG